MGSCGKGGGDYWFKERRTGRLTLLLLVLMILMIWGKMALAIHGAKWNRVGTVSNVAEKRISVASIYDLDNIIRGKNFSDSIVWIEITVTPVADRNDAGDTFRRVELFEAPQHSVVQRVDFEGRVEE